MSSGARGTLAALYRHPVKGFTPEAIDGAQLDAGRCFPCDRLYAVEDGPSGFDAARPSHIGKMRFAVLAKIPEVARVRSRYDHISGEFAVEAEGQPPLRAVLTNAVGRAALADWLQQVLGDHASAPLKVLAAPGEHRFMDSRSGFVSLINLASLRDLEAKVGRPLDLVRFRANLYVEGWPPWIENESMGATLSIGEMRAEITKPTGRCRAVHVDPQTGVEDIDLVSQLFNHFGHTVMGVYLTVRSAGRIGRGDVAELIP